MLLLVDASRQDISAQNWEIGNLAAELLLDYGVAVSPIVENLGSSSNEAPEIVWFQEFSFDFLQIIGRKSDETE